TEEISSLIREIQVQIEKAVKMTSEADTRTSSTLTMVGSSESGLAELSKESETLNDLFQTISSVLNEQEKCMSRMLTGIQKISSASEVNAQSADGAARLADDLEGRAKELKGSVSQFTIRS
ncbi:MAG: hypothetical protein R3194_09340, partial [Limnobacter sp.]|nr:hypothetical protein [Limnobacter sp.]